MVSTTTSRTVFVAVIDLNWRVNRGTAHSRPGLFRPRHLSWGKWRNVNMKKLMKRTNARCLKFIFAEHASVHPHTHHTGSSIRSWSWFSIIHTSRSSVHMLHASACCSVEIKAVPPHHFKITCWQLQPIPTYTVQSAKCMVHVEKNNTVIESWKSSGD